MAGYTASAIYLLCLAASTLCAVMLGRSYARTGARLLLWSAISFVLFAGANFLLVLDLLVIGTMDLRLPRMIVNLVAISVLLIGFIWDGED